MKTIKPDNMSLMFRSFFAGGIYYLSVSACAFFDLELTQQNERLIHEQQMWPVIEASLGKGEIFDFGVPKEQGEYLVYGSCYSPEPAGGLEVAVNIGVSAKRLYVLGDCYWTMTGISDPEPFTVMPVDYFHAFGGDGFEKNPLGKGIVPDEEGRTALPNIQDRKSLVGSSSDRPDPAGFAAYPMNWPQRMRYMGSVDDMYLIKSWPYFPEGTDPRYFNTAPYDQRINGFFTGDEKIEIFNMHPEKVHTSSELPGLRARIFMHIKEGGTEVFREIKSRPETIWLFPDKQRGILLFRSSTEVASEDYDDVYHCFAQWEKLSDEPKPLDYYYGLFQEEIKPRDEDREALNAEDVSAEPQGEKVMPETKQTDVASHAEMDPQISAVLKDARTLEANAAAQLKKLGMTPEEAFNKYGSVSVEGNAKTLVELELLVAGLEKQTQELMQRFNITGKDIEGIIESKPHSPTIPADKAIADLRKAGIVNPDLEMQLKEAERLVKEAEKNLDDIKKRSKGIPMAEDMKQPDERQVPSETSLPKKVLTVDDVINRYKVDRNMRGLDLTDLDLTDQDLKGADFTGSVLERTVFKHAHLDNAVFESARLTGADFTGASLSCSRFTESIATHVCFENACLARSNLSDADFTGSIFKRADLTESAMNNTIFENADLEDVVGCKTVAKNALFAGANLSDGDFTGADITGADLSNANLSFAVFVNAVAVKAKFYGASGEQPVFGYAMLEGSVADKNTLINEGRFTHTNFTGSCWEGARLPSAQMVSAILDRSDFSACELQHAVMVFASARYTNFSKADLSSVNMSAINLLKGSLRKSNLTRTDLKFSNLFGVDFYKAKLEKTRLTGANIKRTILIVKPEE